jgi:hypothetical protein
MRQIIKYFVLVAAISVMLTTAIAQTDANENVTLTAMPIGNETLLLNCVADFSANQYDWNFGDGNFTNNTMSSSIQYSYSPGNYTATCVAYDTFENISGTANLSITVIDPFAVNDTNVTPVNDTNITPINDTNVTPIINDTNVTNITPNITNVTNITPTNVTNVTNVTPINDTNITPVANETQVSLTYERISEGEYRFLCEAVGFEAEAYDWNFGDDTTRIDVQENNVTHRYTMPGVKTVFCGVWADTFYETATIRITVDDIEPQAWVDIIRDNDPNYEFSCETDAFTPDTYDWDFGDGTMILDITNQTMNHTYNRSGFFSVTCTAWHQETETVIFGYTHINVTAAPEPVDDDIYIVRERIGDNNYRFTCVTPGRSPQTYDWEIYDVYGDDFERRDHDVGNDVVEQRFTADGKYVVSCTAWDPDRTLIDWQFLTIAGANTPHDIVQETPAESLPRHVTEVRIRDDRASLILNDDARGDIRIVLETDLERVIDVSQLMANNTATIPIGIEFVSETEHAIHVRMAANTTVTANNTWDGMIWLPHEGQLPPGLEENATSVIRIGSDVPLTFDRAVRIVFSGSAGEQVAIERGGEIIYVDTACGDDTRAYGDNLPAGGHCAISVGNDLVLWTKSFSQIITYVGDETTPQLDITEEQLAQRSAIEERERRTTQEFDVTQISPPGVPPGVVPPIEVDEPQTWWPWVVAGLVLLIFIAVIAAFLRTDRDDERYRRDEPPRRYR